MMLVALVGMTACSDDDNDEQKPIIDPVDISGYIFVSSAYFQDMYYGDNATLKMDTENGQYTATFHDPQWGDVTFEDVQIDASHHTLSGTGRLTMVYRGKEGTYDATLSGDITNPTISLPDVMGGTTISFYAGPATLACQLNGNYQGTNSLMVGDTFGPYETEMTYKITANPDGTINVEIPEFRIEGTPMGDLTIGKVTIKEVYYDSANGFFYKPYGKLDEMTQHCKAEKDGVVTMDADYPLAEDSYIQVEQTADGIKVTNSFNLGKMPFPMVETFE